jgi:hypothetical protein
MATERTLQAAILPVGARHVDPLGSLSFESDVEMVLSAAAFVSLPLDFLVKSSGATDLRQAQLKSVFLPGAWRCLEVEAIVRCLRLNALTSAYAPLWRRMFRMEWADVKWATVPLGQVEEQMLRSPKEWSTKTPLRTDHARRQAMLELDALIALLFGISADDLCSIYRTQFPVLLSYEQSDLYDAVGRKIPGEMARLYRKVRENLSEEDRTWTHPQSGVEYVYEFPFRTFDREEDMRRAYAHFEQMLAEKQTLEPVK